jgi:hypothetical protein
MAEEEEEEEEDEEGKHQIKQKKSNFHLSG